MHSLRSAAAALLAVAALVSGALLTVVVVSSSAAATDMDCADFPTQAAAQEFFLANDPYNDPHNLDADGDLIACETLPCPCSYVTTPSPSATPSTTAPEPTVTATATTPGSPTATTSPSAEPTVDWARIIEVVDGDTVNVRMAGVKERVRMLGIDAPEMSSECGAKTATRDLTRKLPTDTRVKLISDVMQDDRDRYGRLLRYVMKRDVDTSWWQVRRGNAKVVLFDGAFTRLAEYRLAQRSARRHDRGIWKAC